MEARNCYAMVSGKGGARELWVISICREIEMTKKCLPDNKILKLTDAVNHSSLGTLRFVKRMDG